MTLCLTRREAAALRLAPEASVDPDICGIPSRTGRHRRR